MFFKLTRAAFLVAAMAGCVSGAPTEPPDSSADLSATTTPPGDGRPVVLPLDYSGRWVASFANDGTVRVIQRIRLEHGTFTHFAGQGGWYRRGGQLCLVESSTWKKCFDTFNWTAHPDTVATAEFERHYASATAGLGGEIEVTTPAGPRNVVFGPHRDRGDRGHRHIANPAVVGRLDYPGLGGCILYGTPISQSARGEPFRFGCGGAVPVKLELAAGSGSGRHLTGTYAGVSIDIFLPETLPGYWPPLR